jgi:hypothetical protein
MAGDGKATPAEYERPGKVAEFVLDDIATWIGRRALLDGAMSSLNKIDISWSDFVPISVRESSSAVDAT